MTSSVLYKYKKSGTEGRLRTEKEYLNNALVIIVQVSKPLVWTRLNICLCIKI